MLALISIRELLPEQSVIVIDAVSVSGKTKGGKRVEQACSETAQTSVTERGVGLRFDCKIQIPVEAFQCIRAHIVQIQVAEIVFERSADEKLERKVINTFRVGLGKAVLSCKETVNQVLPD